ncbi:copper chaperone PCu(A)C [Pelomicrobium methylotrophicum]|uniref:Copper chaperone PCu(A)C n=1 Tax=Pelomicrobium methylotrophicum TaxID=2602750 RepID=A0A5C7F0L1_9PROT|nr:copper chaperone PCu(A)C [Pelomicrobium methylotrophicum]TXF13024.1 copper chaperone PCu(A)C [Pelomicrobium methylotrophicum]
MRRLMAALLCIGFVSAPAAADEVKAGTITIADAWARATPPAAQVGGAYLILKNAGSPDKLVSASTPVAERTEFHRMSLEDGVMKMRHLPAIEVPAHGTIELKPGGTHLMLVGLKQPLKEGERFPLTLRFERSGTVELQVAVRKMGASGHGSH